MNEPLAIRNAMESPEYVKGVAGYANSTFNSVFEIGNTVAPYPACAERVLSLNVVFTLLNGQNAWAGNLVIVENPNLVVTGSNLQARQGNSPTVYTRHSLNWAGYQVSANSGASQMIYIAYSNYTQPTAAYPSTGCGSAGVCNVAPWVGLENQINGADIAQDGTTSLCVVSGSTCTNSYTAWYETLPQPPVNCASGLITVNGGDTIYASVENKAYSGGSNSQYFFFVSDWTTGTYCYALTSDSSLTSPKVAAYIVEDAALVNNGNYEPLAGFGPVSFQGAGLNTGSVANTINNFYPNAVYMENAPSGLFGCGTFTTNVVVGNVNSAGDFTATYKTSQYTPGWATGC